MESESKAEIAIDVATRASDEEADPNAGVEPVAVEAETCPHEKLSA